METRKKVFQEYRRGVLPDTQALSFEGIVIGQDAIEKQTRKNIHVSHPMASAVWEIILVDWSRMFKVHMN